MGCRLTQNITHTCHYNPGGIKEIFLLDIGDFVSYQFKDDSCYDTCLVERILTTSADYIKLATVNESDFKETQENGIYKQELQTFVRSVTGSKTSQLLLGTSSKHLVVFTTYDSKTYSFGSDGGATLQFAQQSGQLGDASGYQVTITKNSLYPLFEVNLSDNDRTARIFDETFDDTFN